MTNILKWALRGTFAVAVGGAILVGGPGYAGALDCPNPDPAWECPPLDEGSCDWACKQIGADSGHCFGPGCCTCTG